MIDERQTRIYPINKQKKAFDLWNRKRKIVLFKLLCVGANTKTIILVSCSDPDMFIRASYQCQSSRLLGHQFRKAEKAIHGKGRLLFSMTQGQTQEIGNKNPTLEVRRNDLN